MTEPKKSKKKTLHDLSRQMPTAAELKDLMDKIDHMDDRAAALVLAALLDNLLEMAIEVNFVALPEKNLAALFRNPQAPLSAFSAKIDIAYALGVYGDDFKKQIDQLRRIRNAFAHSVIPISFEEPLISSECRKLDPQALTELEYQSDQDTPKERFLSIGQMMAVHFMMYIRRVGQLNQPPLGRRQPSPDKFVPRRPQGSDSQS